jgi:uncharacterized protein YjiS (DUF1127 family)
MTALTAPAARGRTWPAGADAVAALTGPLTEAVTAAMSAFPTGLLRLHRHFVRNRVARDTAMLLEGLDDHMLRDLGIERAQIAPTAQALASRRVGA